MTSPRVVSVRTLADDQSSGVLAIVDAANAADGVPPLSEQFLLRIRPGEGAITHLLGYVGDDLAGYAQLDTDDPVGTAAEVVVAPSAREHGVGGALVRAAAATDPRLRVWAHGELPAAAALATRLGYVRSRSLWQMRRPLGPDAPPLPTPSLPDGVSIRTFEPGRDEPAWLEVNARAFASHPEQGRTTMADLLDREHSEWFAASGFFLAERGDRLVGFHWTKVEDVRAGEVYVLGVDPPEQSSGLGKALLLVGLRHLAEPERGLGEITLYVEADNVPAVALYRKLSFVHTTTDTMFSAPRS